LLNPAVAGADEAGSAAIPPCCFGFLDVRRVWMKAAMLKWCGAMMVALLVVSLLGGCSRAKAPSGGAAGEPLGYGLGEPPVTVEFWYMPNGPFPDRDVRREADLFHDQHPNITVRATKLDWSEALTKLTTAAASGAGPDVAQLGTTWTGGITALGALRPFSSPELDGLGGRAAFLPASWTSTHLVGREQVTAVPWFVDVRAVFYRSDVLARLHLEPATAFATWSSLEAALARIKATGTIAALGQPGKNDWNVVHNIAPFVWDAGGDLLSPDATKPAVTSPAAVTGVDYYQRLVARFNSRVTLEKNSTDAQQSFADGQTAVFISNPEAVAVFRAGQQRRAGLRAGWATAPMPAGPKGRFTFLGGSNLSIWKHSRNAGAAYEWVKFLTGEQSQQRFVSAIGLWPARTSAAARAPFATDPAYKAFAVQLADGRQYPAVASWTEVEAALQKNFSVLWDRVAAANAPLPRDQVAALLDKTSADVQTAINQAR
jgi:multiple sugar transport system substrate-binding protein